MAQPPARMPLFSPIATRDGTLSKDARMINCFGEEDPIAKGEVYVVKRPGLVLYRAIASPSTGLGIFNWKSNIYSVFGNQFYKDAVAKGTVDTSGMYTFTATLGATPKLFFKNHAAAYTYDDSNGVVQVTDVDYPNTPVGGCAYLDGTVYVMDINANIQGSGLNDPQSWDPLNKIIAQIEPDLGVYLTKHKVFVIAMKQVTTEVFYDKGNPAGSPLAPILGSKMAFGCRAENSVQKIGDDLVWVALTSDGGVQIVHLSELHPTVISDIFVKRALGVAGFGSVASWSAQVDGHIFYGFTSITSNISLVYDLSTREWSQWTDAASNYFPIVSSTYDLSGKPVLQHAVNGNLYTLDSTVFQDVGVNFPVAIYTAELDGGAYTAKTCVKGEVIGNRIPTSVLISWSNDDYQTYTGIQTVNLDQNRCFFQDGSMFNRRSWLVSHSDNTPFRVKFLELTLAAGSI